MAKQQDRFPPLSEAFPVLDQYYFDFEKKWELSWEAQFAEKTLPYICALSALYCFLCFAGKFMMRSRKPFGLKRSLAMWNLFLAIFSFCGMMRVVPQLLYAIYERGTYYTICTPPSAYYGYGASGLWCTLFVASKIPELIDTVFIVLRKKPLIFLHYYHHITVMLFSWQAFARLSSSGIYFIAMNYTVHAVMYFYYFLTAIGYRPSWAPFVTILQLSQMAVGVAVCAASVLYRKQNKPCAISDESLQWGILMYSSYFALFLKFFLDRFCFRKSTTAPTKSKLQ